MSHDDLVLEAADGNRFAAFLASPEEPARVGVVILPDVRGLYRFYEELALRFAERGYAAARVRLLRTDRRRREARRRLRVHAARAADDTGGRPGRCGRVRRASPSSRVRGGLHGRVLLRRPQLVARCGVRARPRRRDRLLRPTWPGQRRLTGPDAARSRDDLSDPRPAGRRRPGDPRRGLARLRRRAHSRRCRPRGRDLRRRAAQLLRPQARGVRGRVRGRVEPRARFRRPTTPERRPLPSEGRARPRSAAWLRRRSRCARPARGRGAPRPRTPRRDGRPRRRRAASASS